MLGRPTAEVDVMRRSAVVVALLAVLLWTQQPAAAVPGNVARSAAAFWDVGDPLSTRVSLQPTSARQHAEPGAPVRSRQLFLFVTQQFCDTTTDELVLRSFASQSELRPQDVHVLPNLRRARLDATVDVDVFEQRLSSCTNPSGTPTSEQLPDATVTIEASWDATGPATPTGPGFVTRPATATGTLTSPSSAGVGDLGTADFASLFQLTS
jgi:hypothetical protein